MAMTSTHLSLEEYLHTSYQPDAEYVDGELEERNVGEYEHNLVQLALTCWFNQNGKAWNIRAIQEQRTRLTESRYRIPDVCVFRRDLPKEQIFTQPQIVAIEVLSKDDTQTKINERLEDFVEFGVQNVWVIDPIKRVGWNCPDRNWTRQERFEVTGSPIYLSLNEFFQKIDTDELP